MCVCMWAETKISVKDAVSALASVNRTQSSTDGSTPSRQGSPIEVGVTALDVLQVDVNPSDPCGCRSVGYAAAPVVLLNRIPACVCVSIGCRKGQRENLFLHELWS